MRVRDRTLLIAIVALACTGDVGGPTTPEYDVIDLGALLPPCEAGTTCESRAYDINETAVIVGFHTTIGPFLLDGTTLTVATREVELTIMLAENVPEPNW